MSNYSERWANIKNNHYSISDYGQLRNDITGKILKPRYRKDGYSMVGLYTNGKPKNFQTHRLVGEYFIPNPDNKPWINHIDGNPKNNHYTNLEWCTPKENSQHAVRIGLFPRGEKHHLATLTDLQVAQIRLMYSDGVNQYKIASQFGINQSVVSRYVNRKRGGAYR